jgi:hypothetical protein
MSEQENCPSCNGELQELELLNIKVSERIACPFWDVNERNEGICRIFDTECPEEGEIWPDCCPLLTHDGVCVELDQ